MELRRPRDHAAARAVRRVAASAPTRTDRLAGRDRPGSCLDRARPSYTDVAEFCGLPVHGWWRPEWARWEDKTLVDGLWQRASVPAPPFAVIPVDEPSLGGWYRELDRGRGVILAADATRAFLGSSKGLRWLRDATGADDALRTFDGITDRVRVAAFMPGTPCSILGMVLPTGVAVFEPRRQRWPARLARRAPRSATTRRKTTGAPPRRSHLELVLPETWKPSHPMPCRNTHK
jgi:hypothetical protein